MHKYTVCCYIHSIYKRDNIWSYTIQQPPIDYNNTATPLMTHMSAFKFYQNLQNYYYKTCYLNNDLYFSGHWKEMYSFCLWTWLCGKTGRRKSQKMSTINVSCEIRDFCVPKIQFWVSVLACPSNQHYEPVPLV